MLTLMRYAVLVLATVVAVHVLVGLTSDDYRRTVSLTNLKKQVFPSTGGIPPYKIPSPDLYSVCTNWSVPERRADAAIVMLARNGDLNSVLSTVKQVEDRFNKKFKYPYVFLNQLPFTKHFKELVTALTDVDVQFGLIPPEHWNQPPEIDERKASKAREEMIRNHVIYGESVSYRNMCRYNSGFFYRHELLKPFKYYWRIEPGVTFFCDLDYDPFLYMQDNDKLYGFTLALPEFIATIPTLWSEVKAFMANHTDLIARDNALAFLSDDGGATYNRCHFWSNFEIANLDLWRGEAYTKFFEHLDQAGGFYYERWGDAPVHSIGAALFARKDQIHFFDDIGYRHEPYQHCPQGELHKKGKCFCDPGQTFDYSRYSCKIKYDQLFG